MNSWLYLLVVAGRIGDPASEAALHQHLERVETRLYEEYEADSVVVVLALIGLGENIFVGLNPKPRPSTSLLLTTVDHFLVLLGFEDGDLLSIQKFLRTRDRLQAKVRLFTWSILDELGAYYRSKGAERLGTPHEVLRETVDYFFGELEREIAQLDSTTALNRLLNQYEAQMFAHARFEKSLPYQLLTEQGDRARSSLLETHRRRELTASASRFLVEYAAACPPKGSRVLTNLQLDRLLAIASHIIHFGEECDQIYYGLVPIQVEMLKSGRLGVDRGEFLRHSKAFGVKFTFGKAQRAVDDLRQETESPAIGGMIASAWAAEWGLTLRELVEAFEAIHVAGEYDGSAGSATLEQVRTALTSTGLSASQAEFILERFSLEPRDRYLAPPPAFSRADVFPWKMNRALSLLRRPLIRVDDRLVWGRRSLAFCPRFLHGQCLYGRHKANSKAMREVMSKIANIRGKEFNSEVFQALAALSHLKCRMGVDAVGRVLIANEKGKLGDIDVLCIDERKRDLWLLECKDFAGARTGSELKSEVDKLFNPGGFVAKHGRRVEWVRKHLKLVLAEYALKGKAKDWRVRGRIITDRAIYSPYLRESSVRIEAWVDFRKHFGL